MEAVAVKKAPPGKFVRALRRITPGKVVSYIVLTFWALTTIYPFFWVIINSFRYKGMIRRDSFSIVLPGMEYFTMDNYNVAFDRYDVPVAYRNSLVISISVTVVVILLAGLAAYGLVRYNFKGKNALRMLVVASMMFPVFCTIIPVYRMEVVMGLASQQNTVKSIIATILPQIAGNLSFAMIVLMGFIRSLPIEVEESAFLDGCNVYKIFFRIVMPMARPSFATVAIFSFLWSYNDLFTQSFFLRLPKEKTITLLLNEISSQAGVNYGLMAAAVVIVVVPVLIVYVLLQKNIIKGMTVGAIKG
ncbi:carbohydrate ABC transporter permease [Christensenellaceae bacterium OttesenSCG-928-L17]|nr:carbohydrate ABC transporter permease [Christensenellaceae bacterium OttesenSCG-928-L17]